MTTARTAPPRLRYETLGHLLNARIPARDYLVDPWMRQGESALVYAAPGVGKSMLTLTLALAVAGGGTFLNWKAPAPRRVLLVDGEMARADIKERAEVLLPTVANIDAGAAGRNLDILARQSQDPDAEFPDLGTPEGAHEVIRRARRSKTDLLILDNFSTLFTCEDENSAAAIRPAVKLLMRLKTAGIACVLVHHTNKGGETYRGSSMLATTFEVIFGLTKGAGATDTAGPTFEVTFDKFRGKRRDDVTVPRRVSLEETPEGLRWSGEKSTRAHIEDLIAALKSGRFGSQKALAEHFGVAPSTINRWKTEAIHSLRLLDEDAWGAYLAQAHEGDGTSGDF